MERSEQDGGNSSLSARARERTYVLMRLEELADTVKSLGSQRAEITRQIQSLPGGGSPELRGLRDRRMYLAKRIEILREEEKTLQYQRVAGAHIVNKRVEEISKKISTLGKFLDLTGKSVLEIGADPAGIATDYFVRAGAAEVVSTNMAPNWPSRQRRGKVTKMRVDGRRLSEVFGNRCFDVVFGCAVLEHIVGLDIFLEEAHAVLRPGGYFYSHGAPLWTFAKGHHVWVHCGPAKYHFSDGNNPIGDWRHLVNDSESLASELRGSGIPAEHAEKIVRYVYSSPALSRIGYASMKRIFAHSPLKTVHVSEIAFKGPSAELAAAIHRGPFGNEERYDVAGLAFISRRDVV